MALYRIYTLTDPRNNHLFYVGASRQPDNLLIARHMSYLFGPSLKRELRDSGLKPILDFVDEASTVEEAAVLEEYWYYQLKTWGFALTNSMTKSGSFRKYRPDTHIRKKYRDSNAA